MELRDTENMVLVDNEAMLLDGTKNTVRRDTEAIVLGDNEAMVLRDT